MKSREQILESLGRALPALRERYPLGRVALFGSFVRGEQTAASDVDLAVDFTGPMRYRESVGLQDELAEALGVPVDLSDRSLLRPRLLRRVEAEAVVL